MTHHPLMSSPLQLRRTCQTFRVVLIFVFFTSVSSRNEITDIIPDGKCTPSLSSASSLYVCPTQNEKNSIHINIHTWILQS